MDIAAFQSAAVATSRAIREKRGATPDDYVSLLHIIEELGEIARQLYNQQRKREAFSPANLAEEFADLLLLLADFADRKGVNLDAAVSEKLRALKQRHGLE